ncbi:MAG: metal-dependent hydrolase [Bacteroidetes bacterium]|nr:metal-dependent hydrolase [Bacteroidota bacterium]
MVKLTYIGHSAFVVSDGNNIIAIDPFITGNPTATIKAADINPNFIVLTHAHGDHLGDTVELAKSNDATVIAVNELAIYLGTKGLKYHPLHIGGEFQFPFGSVKLTIAHHSSVNEEGVYMGPPAGAIINIGGKKIYHTGDTGLFSDMQLIGEISQPDVMLVPIGDNFTMGIEDAVKSVQFVKPKLAIPMHYNTFPVILADPNEFVTKVKANNFNSRVMEFGETIEI